MTDRAPEDVTAAFRSDLADMRQQVEAALDRSIDRCSRCKVCDTQINAVMAALGVEFDRLHAALEHAASAAAGSGEGTRLWMLDCGELVSKHRERAERAEAKLAASAEHRNAACAALRIAETAARFRKDDVTAERYRAAREALEGGSEEESRDPA